MLSALTWFDVGILEWWVMCHSTVILILVYFCCVVSTGTGAEECVERGSPDFEYLRLEWTQIISTHRNALLQC